MSQLGIVKYSYLAFLSQPASDRPIYRELRQHPVKRIVELGVGSAIRAQRIIEMVVSLQPGVELRYTGLDLFEARPPERRGISLKTAYTMLRRLPAEVQLIPGDPFTALARWANDLIGTDLLLIAADQDPESMARAWTFVPRMLHEQSLIFREQSRGGQTSYERLSCSEVETLAAARRKRRAA
jgi:hypothetical protein